MISAGETKYKGAATPFTVAVTPAIKYGSGMLPALSDEGAICDPTMVRSAPGANASVEEAELLRLVIAGDAFELDGVACTVTVEEAPKLEDPPAL
jgi:hypothetical protein